MIRRNSGRRDHRTQEVRDRLVAMAEALEQRQDVLTAAWDSIREEVVDEVDRATHVADARFNGALDSAISEARAGIAHALAVLDSGGYGSCEDCGSSISEARLSFRPESTRCLHCQDLADRRGNAVLTIVELTHLPRPVSQPGGDDGRILPLIRPTPRRTA